MDEDKVEVNRNFAHLIVSLQITALQQMGKTTSPITGKVERNMEQAKATIDMLEMIAKKTSGNLTADEDKYLNHVLYELRMNYVDEVNRDKAKGEEKETAKEESSSEGEEKENENTADDSAENGER
jgi:hypothetical protein